MNIYLFSITLEHVHSGTFSDELDYTIHNVLFVSFGYSVLSFVACLLVS